MSTTKTRTFIIFTQKTLSGFPKKGVNHPNHSRVFPNHEMHLSFNFFLLKQYAPNHVISFLRCTGFQRNSVAAQTHLWT